MPKLKLTKAQMSALRMVQKRKWPAGEPRLGWLHAGTAARLLRDGLIAKRPGSEGEKTFPLSPIVDLTEAGRAALAGERKDG